MIDLTRLAKEYRTDSRKADFGVLLDAVDAVLGGDPVVRCSQHGFRGTPYCNNTPTCVLQAGVFVPVVEP